MTGRFSTMTESDLTSPTSTTPSSSVDFSGSKKMDDKMSYRKSNKPMMEKKRRARINSCLTQLKSLVLQAMKKDNSQYSKLEKADILELTVKHLKNVQRLHNGLTSPQVPDAMTKYRAGFNECANEVMRYLGETQAVDSDARTRILSHLATILTPINSLPLQQSHTPILPAPVAAPSSSSSSTTSRLQINQNPQQRQQAHIVQHALETQQQQQHQQGQQLHQHQQHVSALLAQAGEIMPVRQDSVQSAIAQACHVTGAGSELNHVMSVSSSAFQSPAVNSIPASSSSASLQIPCIATTHNAMTSLQLVPSALPTGHVAFVLAPQTVPAMNVYTPSAISSSSMPQEFPIPVLEQQQQQQKQQQPQQQLIKQEQNQLSSSVTSRLTSNDSPIALVTKSNKATRLAQSSAYVQEMPHSSVSSSSSSSLPPMASQMSSVSSRSLPTSLSHSRDLASQSLASVPHYVDASSAKAKTNDCSNKQDNIENMRRGEHFEYSRLQNYAKLRTPIADYPRRGISDHCLHENIENSRRDTRMENSGMEIIHTSPLNTTETRGRYKNNMMDSIKHGNGLREDEEEEDMEMQKRRKVDWDMTNSLRNSDGVIDFRKRKSDLDDKVKTSPPTWRPW